jgi:hypothetical protein
MTRVVEKHDSRKASHIIKFKRKANTGILLRVFYANAKKN